MKANICYLVLSDVHLGHHINPTERIVENLTNVINKYDKQHLDIIFIAGDLFDRLLDNSMVDLSHAQLWMCWLLRFCEKRHIKLRVLEGTRSHDRGQSSQFSTVYHIAQSTLDFKYIPYLYIENIEDLGINVLYVPDEWHEDPSETFKQVQKLLADNQLSHVDISIMHGQFGYQLVGAPPNIPKHREEQYLSITKHYIHIGHVHTYSQFERILAQGSFDRLAHGEEGPKGLVYVEIRKDGSHTHEFIENPNAMIFKTIKVSKKDLESSIAYLDKHILKYPVGSRIRLQANKDHPIFINFSDLELRYILYGLTKKLNDKIDGPAIIQDIKTDEYQILSITRENFRMLLTESLRSKATLLQEHWVVINQILEQEIT